jgi:hypothetical protein
MAAGGFASQADKELAEEDTGDGKAYTAATLPTANARRGSRGRCTVASFGLGWVFHGWVSRPDAVTLPQRWFDFGRAHTHDARGIGGKWGSGLASGDAIHATQHDAFVFPAEVSVKACSGAARSQCAMPGRRWLAVAFSCVWSAPHRRSFRLSS